MFEFFIAKRYLKARHKFSFITIINMLSILGITIGVAALIVVLAVFNGFGSLVTKTLLNFDPHLQITFADKKANTALIDSLLNDNDNVKSFSPFIDGRVVLISDRNFETVSLKGIREYKAKKLQIKSQFISRNRNTTGATLNRILLGLPLALKLGLRTGDTVNVISTKELEKSAVTLRVPQIHKFILDGIYEINNKEYAFSYAFTDLTSAQRTLGFGNKINGVEVFLKDFNEAENFKAFLSNELTDSYKIYTWYDLHKNLYDVMLLERWAAYILLSLIIAVAVFNILTSLTMSVIEKRKDIALLQTMGAQKKSILRIFMFEGMLSGTIGTIAGTILGVLIYWIQLEFKIYALDPMKYIIDALPVELRYSDLLVIAGMSLLLSFLASLYPAKRSLKLNLIESIKWE